MIFILWGLFLFNFKTPSLLLLFSSVDYLSNINSDKFFQYLMFSVLSNNYYLHIFFFHPKLKLLHIILFVLKTAILLVNADLLD